MAFIEWNDKCSVGIAELDAQHKNLFSIVNELHQAIGEGRGDDRLAETFDSLLSYLKEHFHGEEKLMEEWEYPGLSTHRNAHVAFATNWMLMYSEFRDGNTAVSHDLLKYLTSWLFDHTTGIDQQYAAHISARKAAEEVTQSTQRMST